MTKDRYRSLRAGNIDRAFLRTRYARDLAYGSDPPLGDEPRFVEGEDHSGIPAR